MSRAEAMLAEEDEEELTEVNELLVEAAPRRFCGGPSRDSFRG